MKKFVLGGIILIGILTIVFISLNFYSSDNRIEIQLVRCIDGDTGEFLIRGSKEKVRFLGIDAPELSDNLGEEASQYTCRLLKEAKTIEIEFDANSDRFDKYDRVLGWIFVDNNNLSELLLSRGYAIVEYVYGNYNYIDELCIVQDKSYQQRLGIWENSYLEYENNYCKIR